MHFLPSTLFWPSLWHTSINILFFSLTTERRLLSGTPRPGWCLMLSPPFLLNFSGLYFLIDFNLMDTWVCFAYGVLGESVAFLQGKTKISLFSEHCILFKYFSLRFSLSLSLSSLVMHFYWYWNCSHCSHCPHFFIVSDWKKIETLAISGFVARSSYLWVYLSDMFDGRSLRMIMS